MQRTLFDEGHDQFRRSVLQFIEREVKPHQARWREAGIVDRQTWTRAGEAGLLCPWLEEAYGGTGGDFLHSVVVMEELARAYETGLALPLHSDVVTPYLSAYGSEEQKQRWLPRCATGELITAIAMTEPGAGSDLANIRATAVKDRDAWVLNGSKTFITNGILCDLCIVAAKTDPDPAHAHRGISLFVVEAGTPGFNKGKKLEKIGLHSQDTAELFIESCRVPAGNLLGEVGGGFPMLMQKLQQERLVVAIRSQATAEQILEDTLAYCRERSVFGRPLTKFQNTQFKLAECATEIEVGRTFVDRLLADHLAKKDLVKEASMAKLWVTEMAGRVVDTCLQLFGGYGFMAEFPVARAFTDVRVQRIYAGTSEIMKTIIAKQLGL